MFEFKSHLSVLRDVPILSSQFVVIAAARGEGKSTLLYNIVVEAKIGGNRVTMVDAEGTYLDNEDRFQRAFRHPDFEEHAGLFSVAPPMATLGGQPYHSIRSIINRLFLCKPLEERPHVLTIDNLQHYLSQDFRIAAEEVRYIKEVCVEYGVTIIATVGIPTVAVGNFSYNDFTLGGYLPKTVELYRSPDTILYLTSAKHAFIPTIVMIIVSMARRPANRDFAPMQLLGYDRHSGVLEDYSLSMSPEESVALASAHG